MNASEGNRAVSDPVMPPRGRWLGAVFVVAYTATAAYLLRDLRHDDAYITYRYAQNIVLGRGMVFNPGERVLGTTSPLQTLLCVPAYALAGEALPVLANGLGAAALAGSAWLMHSLVLSLLGAKWAGWAAATVALGAVGQLGYVGLETNLVLLLVLAAMGLTLRGRTDAAAVVLALAYLARPDSILAWPAVAAMAWSRTPRFPWRGLGLFTLLCAAWHLFAWRYYGTFFTETLAAKYRAEAPVDYLLGVTRAYGLLLARGFIEMPTLTQGWSWAAAALVPLAVGAAQWVRSGGVTAAAVLLYPALIFAGYTAIGPPLEHMWHTVPAASFLAAFAVIGLGRIGEGILRRLTDGGTRRSRRIAAAIPMSVFLTVHAFGAARFVRTYRDLPSYGQRERKYTEIAAELRAIVHADEKVLAPEIGTLAFKTDLRFVDASGLITPGIRGIRSAGNAIPRTPFEEILALYDPEWVLIMTRNVGEGAYRYLTLWRRFDGPPFASFDLLRRKRE